MLRFCHTVLEKKFTGSVKNVLPYYGFIYFDMGQECPQDPIAPTGVIFFPMKEVKTILRYQKVAPGDRVEFEVEERAGKKCAVRVTKPGGGAFEGTDTKPWDEGKPMRRSEVDGTLIPGINTW